MPTSASTPRGSGRIGVERFLAGLSRYDLVLALIPIAFLLGGAATVAVDLPLRVGLSGAGALGGLFLLDALFLNPPEAGTGHASAPADED